MRAFSILFIVLGICSISSTPSSAHRLASAGAVYGVPVWSLGISPNFNSTRPNAGALTPSNARSGVDLHDFVETNVAFHFSMPVVDTPADSTYLGDSLRNSITSSDDTGSFSSGIHHQADSTASGAAANPSPRLLGTPSDDNVYVVGASLSSGSNAESGVITISTADSAGDGNATFPYDTTYATVPVVVLTPSNSSAEQSGHIVGYYVTCNANNFILNIHDNGNATSNAKYNYIVIY